MSYNHLSNTGKTKLIQDQEPWRPIHYLGSKLRILEKIESNLNQITSKDAPVCDLFAGSGTVSSWLGKTRKVTAIDIQEYSRILCSALLSDNKIFIKKNKNKLENQLRNIHKHKSLIVAEPLIEIEENLMSQAKNGDTEQLAMMIESGSLMTAKNDIKNDFQIAMNHCWKQIEKFPKENYLSTMTLRHFGGIYFSFKQAAEIDALLDMAENYIGLEKDLFTAAILATASEVVNTVGKHFAQPLRPRDKEGKVKKSLYNQTSKDRNKSITKNFLYSLEKFCLNYSANFNHEAIRSDYLDYLSSKECNQSIIYADPPYTRDHYSRFYHVLETLSLRDDPEISSNKAHGKTMLSRGIYRKNRHQSPFCIRNQAPKAFQLLFSKISEKKLPLVLSYSPYASEKNAHPRVMTIDQIREIALNFFSKVDIDSVGKFSHSKLNRTDLNKEISFDSEYLFICR